MEIKSEKYCKHFLLEGTCWLCKGNQPSKERDKADIFYIPIHEHLREITNPSFGIWPEEEIEKK